MAHFGKLATVIRCTFSQSPSPSFLSRRGMATTLFVGGMSFVTSEKRLRQEFETFGELSDVRIVVDRDSGRSRGFGFVTFVNDAHAQAAQQARDGSVLAGRIVKVDYATSSQPKPAGMNSGFGAEAGFSDSASTSGESAPGFEVGNDYQQSNSDASFKVGDSSQNSSSGGW